MKIVRKSRNGGRREALVKEYFVTASLVALLKKVGEQVARATLPAPVPVPIPVRPRR